MNKDDKEFLCFALIPGILMMIFFALAVIRGDTYKDALQETRMELRVAHKAIAERDTLLNMVYEHMQMIHGRLEKQTNDLNSILNEQ